VLATEAEIKNSLQEANPELTDDDIHVQVAPKVEVVLLCDIDLGGGNNTLWSGIKNTRLEIELDGQGHYIYNGKNGYFLESDQKFAIHDVTFSNFYIGHTDGMFKSSVKYAYFNNVNWENCVAIGGACTAVVLGNSYDECYFKDCTIRNSYVRGNGTGHCSFFASFNGTDITGRKTASYLGDTTKGITSHYYTNVPELAEAERAWNGKKTQNLDYAGSTLSKKFPSIYEGCATVDCELYETKTGTDVYHSGGFVSCIRSNVIFKNCYSNTSVYGNRQLGVFIGGVIGCNDGFYYQNPISRKQTLVSAYFEGCYTSGKIEGKTQIGGFIGVIFNDGRAVGPTSYYDAFYSTSTVSSDSAKGSAIFYNCYSTSSVGMEYSGECVGGFVGLIRGNKECGQSNKTENKHQFINCYTAGEVGGIKTRTDNTGTNIQKTATNDVNDNTIGGFIGVYRPEDYYVNEEDSSDSTKYNVADLVEGKQISGITTDCYYDMQTTGMREREVGTFTELGSGVSGGTEKTDNCLKSFQLTSTLAGLTGVYTQESTDKQITGLTAGTGKQVDGTTALFSSGYNVSTAWNYTAGYYPQLTYFGTSEPSAPSADASLIEWMKYYRSVRYYYDSMASTSTVYLDHYDTILDTDGNEKNVKDMLAKADSDTKKALLAKYQTVYDTVRDITRKFEFTSDKYLNSQTNNLKWAVSTSDFATKLGESSAGSYKIELNYTVPLSDSSGSTSTSTTTTGATSVTQSYTPSVLVITAIKGIYKCLNFAPGKQWVAVTATSKIEDKINVPASTSTTTNYITGTRKLRLLPSAYLNAGNVIHVNVVTDNKGNTKGNTVYYTNTNTGQQEEVSNFNHSIGVAYALSDRYRMGTDTIYKGQKLADYSTELNSSSRSTDVFAYYDQFNKDGNNKLFDNVTANQNSGYNYSFKMLDQDFSTDVMSVSDGYLKNTSTKGKTLVRIYHASLNNATQEVEQGKEINYLDTDNKILDKWEGRANFTADDAGYYYLYYYWQLDDGRYLMDTKLVRISASTYDVTMVTGILNEKQTVEEVKNTDGTISYTTAIDQFVTDEVTKDTTGWTLEGSFPSSRAGFTADNAKTFYEKVAGSENEYLYNTKLNYGEEIYYTKSYSISTYASTTAVQWKRTTDYSLTTLIIEAIDATGKSHPMTRIDNFEDNAVYTLENAEYAYNFTSYEVTQDPETKLFSIKETDGQNVTFKVESGATLTSDSIDKYIVFSFETNANSQTTTYSTITDNLKVTALFRKNTADVEGTKTVLLKPENEKDEAEQKTGTKLASKKASTSETSVASKTSDNSEVSAASEDSGELEPSGETETSSDSSATSSESTLEETEYTYYESLAKTQACYEVDDTNLDDKDDDGNATAERKAVLPGDTLTYRVKLRNVGYFESGEVKVTDTIPENCTYIPNSMKIYRQKIDLSSDGEYGEVELVAQIDASGKVSYSSDAMKTLYSDYLAQDVNFSPFTQISTKDDELVWIIPGISLDYDYYVQYDVTVGELLAKTESGILKNTAQWSFYCHNGNVSSDATSDYKNSLKGLLASEIFNISMEYTEPEDDATQSSTTSDNVKKVTYTVDFSQKDTKNEYTNITFTDELPTGFTLQQVIINQLDKEGKITATWSGEVVDSGLTADTDVTLEKLKLTADSKKIEISGFDVKDSECYEIEFTGEQQLLGSTVNSETLEEIKNKAQVTYYEESQTNASSSEKNSKANSVTRIERLSNQVETDVVHLYYEIDKKVESDICDPSQSYLFKVSYYKNQAALDAATETPSTDVSYVSIRCTTQETEKDADGKETKVYTGSQLIQLDRRGYYVIEEVTDWSKTDYDFVEVVGQTYEPASTVSSENTASTDTSENTASTDASESATLTAASENTTADGTSNQTGEVDTSSDTGNASTILKMHIDETDSIDAAKLKYIPAVYTYVETGLIDLQYHTVSFTNKPSQYAYLSGQAYAKNAFKFKAENTIE
jgi:uncharacterized repeat protein (TIGR01451 family)